jgi:hypothetical protein
MQQVMLLKLVPFGPTFETCTTLFKLTTSSICTSQKIQYSFDKFLPGRLKVCNLYQIVQVANLHIGSDLYILFVIFMLEPPGI